MTPFQKTAIQVPKRTEKNKVSAFHPEHAADYVLKIVAS